MVIVDLVGLSEVVLISLFNFDAWFSNRGGGSSVTRMHAGGLSPVFSGMVACHASSTCAG